MAKNLQQYLYNFCLALFLFLFKARPAFAAIESWDDCLSNEGVPTLKCLEVVFGNILTAASALIIVVLFIMFVIGSLNYLTSGGNPEKVKRAQATLMWAVIGTLLFIGAYLILNVICALFLGGIENCQLFKFEIPEY